jgi:hypothetical protein
MPSRTRDAHPSRRAHSHTGAGLAGRMAQRKYRRAKAQKEKRQ